VRNLSLALQLVLALSLTLALTLARGRHTHAPHTHARHTRAAGNFFHDVHELYVKVLMNPFHEFNTPIASPLFDARVKVLGRKYF
jgi:hypothetical protein